MDVNLQMNAQGGPSEARRTPGLRSRSGRFGGVGKEGASADCAGEMKDTTVVSPWRLHWFSRTQLLILFYYRFDGSHRSARWPEKYLIQASTVEILTNVRNAGTLKRMFLFSVLTRIPSIARE